MVCPALFPPAKRAQMSTSAESMSTSLPLPSSPHCAPSTAVTLPIGVRSAVGRQPVGARCELIGVKGGRGGRGGWLDAAMI
jgi:hypothetical protein